MTRTRRIILVGEMPSARGDGTPFSGPSGDRMTRVLGRDWREVMEGKNVFAVRREGGEWDVRRARRIGAVMRDVLAWETFRGARGERASGVVLMAGRRVADALGGREWRRAEWYERLRVGASLVRFYVVPHPSGLSRVWNDPREVERFKDFILKLLTAG